MGSQERALRKGGTRETRSGRVLRGVTGILHDLGMYLMLLGWRVKEQPNSRNFGCQRLFAFQTEDCG